MGNSETLSYVILGAFAFLMISGTVYGIINARKQQHQQTSVSPELQNQFDMLRMQLRLESRDTEIKRYQEALAECRGLVASRLGNEGLQILDSDVHVGGDLYSGKKGIGRDAFNAKGDISSTKQGDT